MIPTHKPQGYSSVSPYLIVTDAARTIAFLEEVLGAVRLRAFPGPDGRLMHAEVRIDDSVVMLADSRRRMAADSRPTSTSTCRTSTRPTRARSRPAQLRCRRR